MGTGSHLSRARNRAAFAQGDRERREQLTIALIGIADAVAAGAVSTQVELQAMALIALWYNAGRATPRTEGEAVTISSAQLGRSSMTPAT